MPSNVIEKLRPLRSAFADAEFLEELLNLVAVHDIVEPLENLCEHEGVLGYHFSRAEPAKIRSEGLVAATGEERRRTFLAEHSHRFSESQINSIQLAWREFFTKQQNQIRDKRVWFALTHVALGGWGTARLLRYFGGESIYMPLLNIEGVPEILSSIGEPVVVLATIRPSSARILIEHGCAKVWLSTYHRSINHRAHQLDLDVFLRDSVGPEAIVSVSSANKLPWNSKS